MEPIPDLESGQWNERAEARESDRTTGFMTVGCSFSFLLLMHPIVVCFLFFSSVYRLHVHTYNCWTPVAYSSEAYHKIYTYHA